MITNVDIKKIISDCSKDGAEIKVREIAYAVLASVFEDNYVAYKSIYRDKEDVTPAEVASFYNSESIVFLRTYLDNNYLKVKVQKSADDVSFEENKAAMVRLISTTEQAMNRGDIEKKDGLKIIADLRVKLNDKFRVVDDSRDSLVVVETKYNDVCEYCGHEIRVPSKEEMIKKYNLIENVTTESDQNNGND